jgi:hypothetical protein
MRERKTVQVPAFTGVSGMRKSWVPSPVAFVSAARRNVLYCCPPDGSTCAHSHVHARTGTHRHEQACVCVRARARVYAQARTHTHAQGQCQTRTPRHTEVVKEGPRVTPPKVRALR